MLKNWNKGNVHRAFPQFCAEYTYTLYFKILHYIVFILEKNHIIPLSLYFELNNRVI